MNLASFFLQVLRLPAQMTCNLQADASSKSRLVQAQLRSQTPCSERFRALRGNSHASAWKFGSSARACWGINIRFSDFSIISRRGGPEIPPPTEWFQEALQKNMCKSLRRKGETFANLKTSAVCARKGR